MAERGWKRLLANHTWFQGKGKYPITAYSEFMPPPRLGRKAYGSLDQILLAEDDPWGWHVTEYEQVSQLDPGLLQIARELVGALHHLGRGEPAHGISRHKLTGNPYWPEGTIAPAGERYVVLAPLALSRTQDDKGRIRWTLFGASEQGPAKGFWRGFYTAPGAEWPRERSLDFVSRLLAAAYGEPLEKLTDLAAAGFRILGQQSKPLVAHWEVEKLPAWTEPFLLSPRQKLSGVKYLLTFEPFERLPAPVRKAWLAGELHLLPFPGSLVFWGSQSYNQLAEKLPFAGQIALLHSIMRHEAPLGIRVPQSGWMHEPREGKALGEVQRGPLRNTFQRTHRWGRVHRYEDELAVTQDEDRVAHVLFSTQADDLGLYGKPMARNAQVWSREFEPLLDGPRAHARDLITAAETVAAGGLFGYRMFYPAMRVGRHSVFWQRPLVAWFSDQTHLPAVLGDVPLGYLTGYRFEKPDLAAPIELWPRLLDRESQRIAFAGFERDHDARYHRTSVNIRKLLDTHDLLQTGPLEPEFARSLLTLAKHQSLADWLGSLPGRARQASVGERLAEGLKSVIAPAAPDGKSKPAKAPGR